MMTRVVHIVNGPWSILTKSLETGGDDFVALPWPEELPPLPSLQ